MDGVKKFFDDIAFENWAPRSSRAWRLSLPPRQQPTDFNSEAEIERSKLRTTPKNGHDSYCRTGELWESLEQDIANSYSNNDVELVPDEGEELPEAEASFTESSDSELNDALNERILEMANGEQDRLPQTPLTGTELRRLIFSKYQRTYDIAFARRDLWGKPIVSLNIMWNHLEQSSFPLTEAQLMERYDRFAIYLNSWEQADQVREFLTEPRKSKAGLPSRPIMGIAVSFQLKLSQHVIAEWFDRI